MEQMTYEQYEVLREEDALSDTVIAIVRHCVRNIVKDYEESSIFHTEEGDIFCLSSQEGLWFKNVWDMEQNNFLYNPKKKLVKNNVHFKQYVNYEWISKYSENEIGLDINLPVNEKVVEALKIFSSISRKVYGNRDNDIAINVDNNIMKFLPLQQEDDSLINLDMGLSISSEPLKNHVSNFIVNGKSIHGCFSLFGALGVDSVNIKVVGEVSKRMIIKSLSEDIDGVYIILIK